MPTNVTFKTAILIPPFSSCSVLAIEVYDQENRWAGWWGKCRRPYRWGDKTLEFLLFGKAGRFFFLPKLHKKGFARVDREYRSAVHLQTIILKKFGDMGTLPEGVHVYWWRLMWWGYIPHTSWWRTWSYQRLSK